MRSGLRLCALGVEHALQLREVTAERVELGGELFGGSIELADFHIAGLELEKVQQLFAHGGNLSLTLLFRSWAHLGLNQGPPDYESGALTS